MLHVGVLGPMAVWRDGSPVRLAGARQRTVLAALAVDAGRVVAADVLVERVWGAELPVSPLNALQQQVLKLRRALGDEAIRHEPPGYRLALGEDAVDAERFTRLVARGRAALDDAPGEAVQLLDEALALWRGAAFADCAYDDWAAAEAARLDELHLQAQELRAEADLRSGRPAEAVHQLEGLIREHPLRERPRALLMLALYRDGRQAEALGAYAKARAALVAELGMEPGHDLRALHARILQQDPGLDERPEQRPARGSGLVGREAELGRAAALLAREEVRFVTLTGPGGVGKTRLARELAARLPQEHPVFVALAAVRDPGDVIPSVARALSLPEPDAMREPAELAEALDGQRVLLVLDNLEQVASVAPRLEQLVARASGVKLLVTSRIALRTAAEEVFTIEPLTVTNDVDPLRLLERSSAARLLAERGRPAGLRVTAGNAATIARVCGLLDGLPLALELAAGRLHHLSPAELEERLDRRLALLVARGRGTAHRHGSLRAAFDVSYELLDDAGREVFERLSGFPGGATLEALEAVCPDVDVVDAVSGLIDSSLVVRVERHGLSRYDMLETIREYGAERSRERGDAAAAARLMRDHFLALAERDVPAVLYATEPRGFPHVEDDHANLVAVLSRADGDGDDETLLRLATALGRHFHRHGHRWEGFKWLQRALELAPDPGARLRGRALGWCSSLACDLPGQADAARALADEALEHSRRAGDDEAVLMALGVLAAVDGRAGRVEAAAARSREQLAVAARIDFRPGIVHALSDLANVAMVRERWDEAEAACRQALKLTGEGDDPGGQTLALQNLALTLVFAGRPAEAADAAREALKFAHELSDREGVAYALLTLAAALARLGTPAVALLAAADAMLDTLRVDLQPVERRCLDETLTIVRGLVEPGELASEWERGAKLTVEEARGLALALGEQQRRRRRSRAGWG